MSTKFAVVNAALNITVAVYTSEDAATLAAKVEAKANDGVIFGVRNVVTGQYIGGVSYNSKWPYYQFTIHSSDDCYFAHGTRWAGRA